ncbi:NlpC/P60 family protein [Cohnella pontilimi]|uniref:NlpC/P60 family protein n=1 Tax=Cohnella pontilimi TaxID=2564100 RepID=A0A4U0F3R4_9BACL|nr:C40 family peptidase [Cohnella pontilimi]TJY38970.1 NlpC/P60 family protein [Cohnella pontilimi]
MRKFSVVLLSLAFLLAFQVGSAFADSKLDNTISKLIGIDYDYGGTTTSGFDCSGFTGYVFKKLGVELPRSSREQFAVGKKVARDDLRPGDLVFFNTNGSGVSHVGIYVGQNKFAHASTSKGVTITSLSESYYAKRYLGARRVLDAGTFEEVATEQPATVAAAKPAPADKVELTAAPPVDGTVVE